MKLAFYAAKLSFLVCLHYKTELKFLIRAVWSCKTKKTARLWAFLEEFAMWGCGDVVMWGCGDVVVWGCCRNINTIPAYKWFAPAPLDAE